MPPLWGVEPSRPTLRGLPIRAGRDRTFRTAGTRPLARGEAYFRNAARARARLSQRGDDPDACSDHTDDRERDLRQIVEPDLAVADRAPGLHMTAVPQARHSHDPEQRHST